MPQRQLMIHCQHQGCTADTVQEWTIYGYDPEPVFFFCGEHAAAFGFCPGCGAFIGGTEETFLTDDTGLCFECYLQLQRDERSAEYDDQDDYEDYPY